jgi:hypothetical protein
MAKHNGIKASNDGKAAEVHEKSECFVIMPISDPAGYEVGHFQRVYEDLVVPACEAAGYRAIRADQIKQTNLIHLDVLQKIIDSPMALCDLSSRNPNVLFELGIRQAFDKPVVLVQEIGTEPIFDINPLRYTDYHKEMLYRQVIEDQQKITDALNATREDIGNTKSVNSIVKLLSLTQPASLASIPEGDRNTELLQVIMAEIGNLRSELKTVRSRSVKDKPLRPTPERSGRWEVQVKGNEQKAAELLGILNATSWGKGVASMHKLKDGFVISFQAGDQFPIESLQRVAENLELKLVEISRYRDA